MFKAGFRNALVTLCLLVPLAPAQAMHCPKWVLNWVNKMPLPFSWKVTLGVRNLPMEQAWMEGISPAGSTLVLTDEDGGIWLHDARKLQNASQVSNIEHSWMKGLFFASEETFFLGRDVLESAGEDSDWIVLDAFKWTKTARPPFKIQQEIHLRVPKGTVQEDLYVKARTIGSQSFLDVEYELDSGEKFLDRFEVTSPLSLFAFGNGSVELVPKYHLTGSRYPSSLTLQTQHHFTRQIQSRSGKQWHEFQIYRLGKKPDGSDAHLERVIHWPSSLSVDSIVLSPDQLTAFVSARGQGLIKCRLTGAEKDLEVLIAGGERLAPSLDRGSWYGLTTLPEAGIFFVSIPNQDQSEIRSLENGALLGRLAVDSTVSTPDGRVLADITGLKQGSLLRVFTLDSLARSSTP